MSEQNFSEQELINSWRQKIEEANQHNIFCHCRSCGYEWVDSQEKVLCASCGGANIEQILCWQFPDD